MKKKTIGQILIPSLLIMILGSCGGPVTNSDNLNDHPEVLDEMATGDGIFLPFTIEFREQTYSGKPPLPRLQSYAGTMTNDGLLLAVGGRRQGLHTFFGYPQNNFIPDSSNNFIFVIDPAKGDYWSFDVNQLPPSLSAPLQATNQQSFFDKETNLFYLVGGYGWKADKSDMITFNTIMSFDVNNMVEAIKSGKNAKEIESMINLSSDDRLAVTGGELFKMGNFFYLVFGQRFDGQYRAFGGTDFTQKYTESVKMFTLKPNTLNILSYGENTSSEADRPFHRRDGNIIDDIDPKTGKMRIASYGGVFKPGIIAPYTYPVYIYGSAAPTIDRTGDQKFSQYECPVISVYDNTTSNPTVYHTFFGGIGHYFYSQTPSQDSAYKVVTKEGRNDGFPFVADVSSFSQGADGVYNEYIQTAPIPGNRLLGTSIPFLANPILVTKEYAYPNYVFNLNNFPADQPVSTGYIYGGIEAINPLPLAPNTGTIVSNSVFEVVLTRKPQAVFSISRAKEAANFDTVRVSRK